MNFINGYKIPTDRICGKFDSEEKAICRGRLSKMFFGGNTFRFSCDKCGDKYFAEEKEVKSGNSVNKTIN